MRREALLLGLGLALGAARLHAFGGTPLPWLGGTEGWETTPAGEWDLAALGGGGNGGAQAGAGIQAGLLDTLQAQAAWSGGAGGPSSGDLGLRWRQPYAWGALPEASAYAREDFQGARWTPWAGLDLARASLGWDGALNAELGDADGAAAWSLRLGAWTPYLLPTLRLGLEASWGGTEGSSAAGLLPQVLFNLPGDLSLQAGARLEPAAGLAPLWSLRLGYEIFPTP